MPTRKQRRRRAKDFRHDMRVFEVDSEGNEVPLAELRSSEERKPKAEKKQQQPARTKGGRSLREPPQPSWQRAIKRGGLMGGLLLVAFVFLLRGGPLPQRILIGVLYGLAFVPLTYWIDRTAYRTYQRRLAKQASAPKKT